MRSLGQPIVAHLVRLTEKFMTKHKNVIDFLPEPAHARQSLPHSRPDQHPPILLPHLSEALEVHLVSQSQIHTAQRMAIRRVQELAGCELTPAHAKVALRRNRWNVKAALELVLEKQDEFTVVPPEISNPDPTSTFEFCCLSCMERFPKRRGCGLLCGHWLCDACWTVYLDNHIQDGEAFLKCPGEQCRNYVDEEVIHAHASCKSYHKYRRWLFLSYVDLAGYKCCPNPSCNQVAKAGVLHAVIACICGRRWCFACQNAGHYPLSCDDARKIQEAMQKQADEAAAPPPGTATATPKAEETPKVEEPAKKDETIFAAELRTCPFCKTLWEKFDGCDHMDCIKCGGVFCWKCGQPIEGRHFCQEKKGKRYVEWSALQGLFLDGRPVDDAWEGKLDIVEVATPVLQFRREMHRLKKLFGKIDQILPRCPAHSTQEVQDMLLLLIEFIFTYSNCYLYFNIKQPSAELNNHFMKARLASEKLFSLFDMRPNFVCLSRDDLDSSVAEVKSHFIQFLALLKQDADNDRLL
eukprot:TRINITY_DN3576_c0_g4_i2.p1 TRINITY_DN3576_c0_g4~~TRINITY_DN3576_c0_g4_i2.p1  ORF type:complete len:523 (-),score=66.88 TRINITY_DN3576_c0_g4_i2:25-1593(-)